MSSHERLHPAVIVTLSILGLIILIVIIYFYRHSLRDVFLLRSFWGSPSTKSKHRTWYGAKRTTPNDSKDIEMNRLVRDGGSEEHNRQFTREFLRTLRDWRSEEAARSVDGQDLRARLPPVVTRRERDDGRLSPISETEEEDGVY